NAKAALKTNGIMLLNEISANSLFAHLTFGLLEGWWLYQDAELRIPGCPGLYPETWERVLKSEGFKSVFLPLKEAEEQGLQIIAAESDGVVRQLSAVPGETTLKSIGMKSVGSRKFDKTPFPGTAQIPKKTMPAQTGFAPTEQMLENHVKTIIRESVSEALKTEEENIDDDIIFSEYGVDSIIAVSLVNLLAKRFGFDLKTAVLFDYNDIDQLTGYIIEDHKSELMDSLQEHTKGLDHEETVTEVSPVIQDRRNRGLRNIARRLPANRFQVKSQKPAEIGQQSKSELTQPPSISLEKIAIIGMSGRFAKSATPDELWKHLANGSDLVETVSRWDIEALFQDLPGEKNTYCMHGGFLADIDLFDPLFFNISGLEATWMDPQQRIFLTESWKALEDAGYAGTHIQGCKCGIYVGCGEGDYQHLTGSHPPAQSFWGNAGSMIPARIAYWLNLQGPAIAVDTACSSSLVAVHLACQALLSGETEMALAGGIHIQSTPAVYVVANRAQMLSPSGRCHTFDQRADGFVPGEGVGVIVLKRLREALADGDNIYGVIRGSGINQDGTTNGITAPSAKSQERLERHVYDTFDIDPEQISMVEAHGTGTKLGDPIEFEALTRAFRKYTDKKAYCALGTIKTNIGHALIAAGIAGVIKILLALKHKKIPPSLHFENCNSDIQMEGSPFYVNTMLKDWHVETGRKRLAAVSSFGFSGTNAHMAIEEAPSINRHPPDKPGCLIVLSARTQEQLQQQAEGMIAYCDRENDVNCGNISYTLLVGRRHLDCRLACIVRSPKELAGLLRKWLKTGKTAQVHVSDVKKNNYGENPSLKKYGNQCILDCRNTDSDLACLEALETIANLFIQGYALEYDQLFKSGQYSKISLPAYPFARERYWIPENTEGRRQKTQSGKESGVLHPLLHANTSDLSEQRFSSVFSGDEFFLSDHIVKGRRVLPGAATLEMARAAVERAAGNESEGIAIRLKNIVWARPVTVGDDPAQLHIALFPEENGEIAFEIFTEPEHGDRAVFSQGSAVFIDRPDTPALDIPSLRAECQSGTVDSARCYDIFKARGIEYGPGFRGIDTVYAGTGKVLAKLRLPSSVSDTLNDFALHPSLLDAALQASIGLSADPAGEEDSPALPFALESLDSFGPCTASMQAVIRESDSGKSHSENQKIDVDLCDDSGRVCVRMSGFSSRVLKGESDQKDSIGALLLPPCWKEQAAAGAAAAGDYSPQILFLCEFAPSILSALESSLPEARCIPLTPEAPGIAERYTSYAIQVFGEIRRIIQAKPGSNIPIQAIVPLDNERSLFSGLAGLLKTARLENPKLICQLIGMDAGTDAALITERAKENLKRPMDSEIRYRDGKRFISDWREIETAPEDPPVPWKEGGVYLITGGAGGLG
ncbi:MAG: polyketide synthase, partial [Gammaproteobacteria bacterium]|nr:polyketide synthase [Gammaproteobacteria bacterium]